jgi:N-acyl-D-aspartate/D-glutamate deacylase
MLLPYEVWEDGSLAAPARLADPLVRDRFARAVEGYGLNLNQLTIAWVGSRENQSWQGATLASYVAASGKSLGDALADLLIDENFCVLMVFHVSGDEAVEPFLAHPRMMLGSDGIYFPDGVVHPRVAGSATRMLGRMVRERKLFSLEEAVRKMTSFPAERFGLAQRGALREGAFADLVVFDPATVADLATYADPQRLSAGVEHVVVAGRPIIEQGAALTEIEAAPPGRALKFRDAAR